MPITSNNPTTVPATTQAVYDKWWVTRFAVLAPDPNGKIRLVAKFTKYRVLQDNSIEFSPLPADRDKSYNIDDLFTALATDTEMTAAYNQILALLQARATTAGAIS